MAKFFIERPIFAWVLALFIIVLGSLAVTQGVNDEAEDGLGNRRMGQVGGNGRGVQLQVPGGEVEVVALFGDGEADDTCAGVTHLGQQFDLVGVVGTANEVNQGANDADAFGVGADFGNGVSGGLPQAMCWYRPGAGGQPAALSGDHVVTGLNDQHCHMTVPADSPLAVGDMIDLNAAVGACGVTPSVRKGRVEAL